MRGSVPAGANLKTHCVSARTRFSLDTPHVDVERVPSLPLQQERSEGDARTGRTEQEIQKEISTKDLRPSATLELRTDAILHGVQPQRLTKTA